MRPGMWKALPEGLAQVIAAQCAHTCIPVLPVMIGYMGIEFPVSSFYLYAGNEI